MQPAGKRAEVEMGAGWGIIDGAIGHSLIIVNTCGHLLKEVPMPPWLFVVVGTCECSSIMVMDPYGHSSIVVVSGCRGPVSFMSNA